MTIQMLIRCDCCGDEMDEKEIYCNDCRGCGCEQCGDTFTPEDTIYCEDCHDNLIEDEKAKISEEQKEFEKLCRQLVEIGKVLIPKEDRERIFFTPKIKT